MTDKFKDAAVKIEGLIAEGSCGGSLWENAWDESGMDGLIVALQKQCIHQNTRQHCDSSVELLICLNCGGTVCDQ